MYQCKDSSSFLKFAQTNTGFRTLNLDTDTLSSETHIQNLKLGYWNSITVSVSVLLCITQIK